MNIDSSSSQIRQRTEEKSKVQQQTKPTDASGVCPHCGKALDGQYEICPYCGGKLVDYCTFCGASMGPDDVDCPECGLPSEGLICPDCNTRNYRPFCAQCGKPLSRAARRAVEKAKQDPKVQQTAKLLMQIAELQAELEGALPGDEDEGPEEPTEGELRLLELMSKVGFTPAEKPKAAARKVGRSREEIMAEYQKAVEEANKVMESMLPPAGTTPQEQRNYYTARKVAVMETVQESWRGIPIKPTMAWECNYCKVLHNNPSECCRPEMGGEWVSCTLCEVVTSGGQIYTTNVERKVYKRL
ncbi:MAG: zinc ribbon domain-containing protein [Bacteroidales bacterium]|nr:zinc ribbon domain-containing protein [Bacteroidales bacterium]